MSPAVVRSDGWSIRAAALAARSSRRLHLCSPHRAEHERSYGAPQLDRSSSGAPTPPSRLSHMHAAGDPIADPQRAFVEHLPTIERVIAAIARRHKLSPSDAKEFGSWAHARIIDSDYAAFRKFAGRSSIQTYLTVVLGNLFLDYRNSIWGRWRPSVAATRLGATGVRLEELLYRDNHTLREALEVLRSQGVAESDVEIGRMSRALPARTPTSDLPLESIEGTSREADTTVLALHAGNDAFPALRAAIDELAPEEQVIVRLRFWDGISIADISRALRIEQKPLYRRIDAIEARLRDRLAAQGFDRERVRELLSPEAPW
jgi:RNA polymerase sigma factor (sigma-70 family)